MINLALLCRRNYLTFSVEEGSDQFIEVATVAGEKFNEPFLGFSYDEELKPDLLVTCGGWRTRFEDSWTYTELGQAAAGLQMPEGVLILCEQDKPRLISAQMSSNAS